MTGTEIDDESMLRAELKDEAEDSLTSTIGRGWKKIVSFDFDYGDTGDESIGVDAYIYFHRKEVGKLTNGKLLNRFQEDIDPTEDDVRTICNVICQVVDPSFDFDEWNNGNGLEFEYDNNWVRVYAGLTVASDYNDNQGEGFQP